MNINNLKNMFSQKNLPTLAGFLGLFLIAAGISWAFFSFVVKPQGGLLGGNTNTTNSKSKLNLNLPKTEECPINGLKFTKSEKDVWNNRRPVTAMIENHADSRPPEGLSKADWVYEAVAEGGITRFMSVFYCGVAAEDVKIAPVRSARVYFVNWASEYADKPLYVHVGGANDLWTTCYGGVKPAGDISPQVDALGLLEKIGWRVAGGNDFDTSFDSGFPVFYRNPERLGHEIATEHTMTVDLDALYQDAEKRSLAAKNKNGISWDANFVKYKFADDQKSSSPAAKDISFQFWANKPDYDVEWKYDQTSNTYLRFNGGQPHTDLEYNKTQLTAKNVVIMKVAETGPVDKEGHMFYQVIGSGDIIVFQNGNVTKGTWSKADRISRTKFMDENGKEITFVRGVTWVEALPSGNDVNYN